MEKYETYITVPALFILLKHPFNICWCLCFSLLLCLKSPLRVQSNNQPQTDRQVIQWQWQALSASLILILSPTTTPCPSVSCSALPLWLFLSRCTLFVCLCFYPYGHTILLINSSTSSTFTAEWDRRRERGEETRDENSRLLIPSNVFLRKRNRERERESLLKHQQKFIALGYVAVRYLRDDI